MQFILLSQLLKKQCNKVPQYSEFQIVSYINNPTVQSNGTPRDGRNLAFYLQNYVLVTF